jgi:N6-L-threonylcarbamoyladenine synthase
MKILSIETSCDETAVSIVEATGGLASPTFVVLGNALFSQIDIHKEYGGVFPMVAKREHAKKLPLLLKETLRQAGKQKVRPLGADSSRSNLGIENKLEEIEKILAREEGLFENFKLLFEHIEKPEIDVISVTSGPGLVPALWVGISFAEALGKLWEIPVVPANHMEGHVISVLVENTDTRAIAFPALALLISGGHTELVEMKNWGQYKILGETRDDAVGEAFDKTARMLGLPYPGGPEVSKLAEYARSESILHKATLPRPMLHSHDLNFSFSGLKTSVLYYIRDTFGGDITRTTQDEKADIAREFEDAVVEVLATKTKQALEETGAKTLIIAGGVIANKKLRATFLELEKTRADLQVKIPTQALTGDNALMIACATYVNVTLYPELLTKHEKIIANGNLRLQ